MPLAHISARRPIDALASLCQPLRQVELFERRDAGLGSLDAVEQTALALVQTAPRQVAVSKERAGRAYRSLVEVPRQEEPLVERGLVVDEKIVWPLVAVEVPDEGLGHGKTQELSGRDGCSVAVENGIGFSAHERAQAAQIVA